LRRGLRGVWEGVSSLMGAIFAGLRVSAA
jgi:hypothetical protein